MSERVQMDFSQPVFTCGGRPFFLVAGEFPYYRVDPDAWPDRLEKARRAGLQALSFYVPWRLHEPSPGAFDFTGQSGQPRRDVRRFVEMAASVGFSFIVKPGPFICAEYRGGGFPDWLLARHPEVAMRDHRGREVRFFEDGSVLPDLLHPTVVEYVQRWYRAVAEAILLPLQRQGLLAAVQVENEFPFSSMHLADPFSWGYAPHERHRYASWLQTKSREGPSRAPAPDPPRAAVPEDAAQWQALRTWLEYREWVATEVLATYGRLLREAGVTAPLYHDLIMLENESPVHFAKMAAVMPVCPNFWLERHPAYDEASYARALVRLKLAADAQPGRALYASETNWSWGSEEEFSFLFWLLAPHLAGLDIYTIVDGQEAGQEGGRPLSLTPEPYPGYAPIDAGGGLREAYRSLQRFTTFLGQGGGECGAELALAREPASVALGYYTPYNHPYLLTRWAGVREPELEALLGDPPRMNPWAVEVASALVRANVAFDVVDVERCDWSAMQRYRLLLLPGYRFMARRVQEGLVAYVRSGGTLLIGPSLPEVDEELAACDLLRAELFGRADLTRVYCYHNPVWNGFGPLGTVLGPVHRAAARGGRASAADERVHVCATLWDGSAVGLCARIGKGTAYWLGTEIPALPAASPWLQWLARCHGVEPTARVLPHRPGVRADDLHVRVVETQRSRFVIMANRGDEPFEGEVRVPARPVHAERAEELVLTVRVPPRRHVVAWLVDGQVRAVLSTGEGGRAAAAAPAG